MVIERIFFYSVEILSLPIFFYILKRVWGWPPLSPNGGGSPRGASPWPPSPFLPSLKRISRQPSQRLSYFFQDTSTVRTKATISSAWKECQNNFPMISTESIFSNTLFINTLIFISSGLVGYTDFVPYVPPFEGITWMIHKKCTGEYPARIYPRTCHHPYPHGVRR